jgi:hypothetical protein
MRARRLLAYQHGRKLLRDLQARASYLAKRTCTGYAAEFDFQHNHRARVDYGDLERTDRALIGAKGKQLGGA